MKKYFILFVLSFTILVMHAIYTKHAIYGDGNGYYVYSQSIYFDHVLNSEKILKHLENFQGRDFTFSRIFWNIKANPYSIGTGIIWLPSMAFMSLFSSDRFDMVYELGPGITGIILMLGGLYFLEKYLFNFFSKKSVFWTILTVFFTSNVLYFTAFEPALSHQPSFFIICFLLWWTRKFKLTVKNLIVLGLLSGFLATVRIADIILLIPIFWNLKLNLRDYFIVVIGGLIGTSPQIFNQYFMYGNPLSNPYLSGANGTWEISPIHLFEYLFSPMRGLFLWSPVFLIGFWGLIKRKSYIFIITILILWLVTSSWSAYLSAGFGQRFSFSAIPYFTIGLAYIFDRLTVKRIILIAVPLLLWNILLFKNFYIHKDLFVQSPDFTIKQFISYMVKLD